LLEYLGHDSIQKLVVELDPAALERLLEDIVDEGRACLVASLVPRKRDDRCVQGLVVEQREERYPKGRIRVAAPRDGKPGYSMSPTRTPD